MEGVTSPGGGYDRAACQPDEPSVQKNELDFCMVPGGNHVGGMIRSSLTSPLAALSPLMPALITQTGTLGNLENFDYEAYKANGFRVVNPGEAPLGPEPSGHAY